MPARKSDEPMMIDGTLLEYLARDLGRPVYTGPLAKVGIAEDINRQITGFRSRSNGLSQEVCS
jgi:hypothetical protein